MHGKSIPTVKEVTEIIFKMVDIGLLDKTLMGQGIITSKVIQKQYYASTIRRKNRERDHWLLSDEDEAKMDMRLIGRQKSELNGISVYKNEVEGELMLHDVDKNEQNKNKKKKKKETDKQNKYDKGKFPGTLNYYTACLIDSEILSIYEPLLIDKFNELFKSARTAYPDSALFNKCFGYTRDYVKRNKVSIDDIFAFFKCAFTNNLDQMEGYDERMEKFLNDWKDILG